MKVEICKSQAPIDLSITDPNINSLKSVANIGSLDDSNEISLSERKYRDFKVFNELFTDLIALLRSNV